MSRLEIFMCEVFYYVSQVPGWRSWREKSQPGLVMLLLLSGQNRRQLSYPEPCVLLRSSDHIPLLVSAIKEGLCEAQLCE